MKPIRKWWDAIEDALGRPGIFVVCLIWFILFLPRLFLLLLILAFPGALSVGPRWLLAAHDFLRFSSDWE
jgi:hypothetical protein